MKQPPSAIVIGAGISGIAAAGQIAPNAFEVAMLEDNGKPRGRHSHCPSHSKV